VILALTGCGNGSNSSSDDEDSQDSPDTEKIVFVSSETYSGNMGGNAGADANCQRLADAALLDGTFKACVSSVAEEPATSFSQSTVPYVLVDGTVIADDWIGLTDGSIDNPINLDENGNPGPATDNLGGFGFTTVVHTGTSESGFATNPSVQTCSDWTSDLGGSTWGLYERAAFGWSASIFGGAPANLCGLQATIYCFEQ